MTTRGMKEKDMIVIAELIHRVTELAIIVQSKITSKKLVDFVAEARSNIEVISLTEVIKRDVQLLSTSFPLPGIATV